MTTPSSAHTGRPLISVVIPTHQRPELLLERSLPSALAQTYPEFEVVVVVDGADPVTESALAELAAHDPRIRPVVLAQNVGGSDARNAGVQAARGEWIAFLDDDDEWLPHNLDQHLEMLLSATDQGTVWPVSVTGSLTRTQAGDTAYPPRLPDPGESVGDYMLARRSPREQECFLGTTAIATRRSLLLAHPFRSGLPRQQDCDWVLRVAAQPQVEFSFTQRVCSVWYFGETRKQISNSLHWPQSLAWILESHERGLASGRAMAGFLNGSVAAYAKQYGDYRALWPLTRAMFRARPRAFEWARFVFIWAVPNLLRQRLRARRERGSKGPPTPPLPAFQPQHSVSEGRSH